MLGLGRLSVIAAKTFQRSAKINVFLTNPSVPASFRFFSTATPSPPPQKKAEKESEGESDQDSKGGSNNFLLFSIVAALGAGGYYAYQSKEVKAAVDKPLVYQEVYNAIADKLSNVDYDDGSYGPILVRLAWHASGTYDKTTKTGGSHGSTMRFAPESEHGANAGLVVARNFLESIKKQFPKITYADLWSLAGVVAIQEMAGPVIKWRPGRADLTAESVTPDGRLPDAAKGASHLRAIFNRMGFNDQEIVALSGAHALGRCHTDRSGFSGPWTFSPTTFKYYKLLLGEKWDDKKWTGPKQFEDRKTKSLMMLPTDMALIQDWWFPQYVKMYAKDSEKFFKDFSAAFQKLEELGVPFAKDTPVYEFKRR